MERQIHKTLFYTVSENKRIYTDKRTANDTRTVFTIRIDIQICWTMHPTTWQRFGLTFYDLMVWFEETPSFATWQAMVLLTLGSEDEITPSNTVLKSPHQTLKMFTFISRRPIFTQFIKRFHTFPKQNKSNLYLQSLVHKPYLPLVKLPAPQWSSLGRLLCTFTHYTRAITCPGLFTFAGKEYCVLQRFDSELYLLSRVAPCEHEITPQLQSLVLKQPRIKVAHDSQRKLYVAYESFLAQSVDGDTAVL